jgi:hypothetical protein
MPNDAELDLTPEERALYDSIDADSIDLDADTLIPKEEDESKKAQQPNASEGADEKNPDQPSNTQESGNNEEIDGDPDYYDDLDWNKINPDVEAVEIVHNGTKMKLSINELKTFAQKGVDYTKKTQELSRQRSKIKALEQSGISDDDISLLMDIKAGNKDAIKSVLVQHKIDPLDIDLEETSNYVPPKRVLPVVDEEWNEVLNEVTKSKTKDKLLQLVDGEWDNESFKVLRDHPKALLDLNGDLGAEEGKLSLYDVLKPTFEKRKALLRANGDRTPDVHIYAQTRNEYFQKLDNTKKTQIENKQVIDKRDKRQAATLPNIKSKAASPKDLLGKPNTYESPHDIPDEEFDNWAKENGVLFD